jgi:hypothetical protein
MKIDQMKIGLDCWKWLKKKKKSFEKIGSSDLNSMVYLPRPVCVAHIYERDNNQINLATIITRMF